MILLREKNYADFKSFRKMLGKGTKKTMQRYPATSVAGGIMPGGLYVTPVTFLAETFGKKQLKGVKGYQKLQGKANSLGRKAERVISGEKVSPEVIERAKRIKFKQTEHSKKSEAIRHNIKEVLKHPKEGAKYLAGTAMKYPTATTVGTMAAGSGVLGAVAGTKALKAKNYKAAALGYGSIFVPYAEVATGAAMKLAQKNKKVAKKFKELEEKGDKLRGSAKLNLKKFSEGKVRKKVRAAVGNTVEKTISSAPTAPVSAALVAAPIPGSGIIGTALMPHESRIVKPVAEKIPGYKKHVISRAEKAGKRVGDKIKGNKK